MGGAARAGRSSAGSCWRSCSAPLLNPEMQLAALKAAGGNEVFVGKASGASRERPQLARALAAPKAWRRVGPSGSGTAWRARSRISSLLEDLGAVGVASRA
jgi:hypothetical protein